MNGEFGQIVLTTEEHVLLLVLGLVILSQLSVLLLVLRVVLLLVLRPVHTQTPTNADSPATK